MNSSGSVRRDALAVFGPRLDALREMLGFAHRLHAARPRDCDELAVVVLGQAIDRVLSAGEAPQQQAAQSLRVSQSKQDGKPCTGGRAAHEKRQRTELQAELVKIVGPN